MTARIIVGLPDASLNGVTVFSMNLVRGLRAYGMEAHILLTEEGMAWQVQTSYATRLQIPADIPVVNLPGNRHDTWYHRWLALIRYLEEQAPCIYIPNHDWRMSGVSVRLSDRVRVVGVVHNDFALEYEHAALLGTYWNAIVGVSETIRERLALDHPAFVPRLVAIPIGVPAAAQLPEKPGHGPLRIVYHGALRSHQKRISDSLDVIRRLVEQEIPVQFTLIGDGTARADIEEKGAALIEQGALRLMGALPHSEVAAHLAKQDVYLLTSEYEGLPNAMLEAMGQGCVPVVSNLDGLSRVLKQGENGYTLPVGDIEGFARRLVDLQRDPDRRREMGRRAYRTVIEDGYRVEDMVAAYIDLFERVTEQAERGVFRRRRRRFLPPPETMGGIQIMGGDLRDAAQRVNKVSLWPNPSLAASPAAVMRARGARRTLKDERVVIAMTSGRISGVDVFSIHLARQLQATGIAVEIVRTRPHEQVTDPLDLPDDLPLETLPVPDRAGWPERWRAMRDYLVQRAPCFYLPNYDWRHSCISPTLPRDVKVVGIVHSDDPQHYEHVVRLGRYWDAVVAVSQVIAAEIKALDPALEDRLFTIPYGVEWPDRQPGPLRSGEPLRVVFAGRLTDYQKRVTDLPHIVSVLVENGVPIELAIIGSGSDQDWLLDRSRQFLVDRQIRFLARLPNDLVLQVMADSDVFLLTSTFEGLPVSMLEAMARGCVPVVSDIRSGIPEVIRDGVNGYRVAVGDVDGFAARLAHLYHRPDVRERMARAAVETVRDGGYRREEMAARYAACFEAVLAQEYHRPEGRILPPPDMVGQTSWIASMPQPIRRALWATRRLVKGEFNQ